MLGDQRAHERLLPGLLIHVPSLAPINRRYRADTLTAVAGTLDQPLIAHVLYQTSLSGQSEAHVWRKTSRSTRDQREALAGLPATGTWRQALPSQSQVSPSSQGGT